MGYMTHGLYPGPFNGSMYYKVQATRLKPAAQQSAISLHLALPVLVFPCTIRQYFHFHVRTFSVFEFIISVSGRTKGHGPIIQKCIMHGKWAGIQPRRCVGQNLREFKFHGFPWALLLKYVCMYVCMYVSYTFPGNDTELHRESLSKSGLFPFLLTNLYLWK